MRPLLSQNMEIHTEPPRNDNDVYKNKSGNRSLNNKYARNYLHKKPMQCCLACIPCVLCIPLLSFFLQLWFFIRNDLLNVRNELVINDVYFENVCDSENMFVKLNISQRWNATFDMYLSEAAIMLQSDNNGVKKTNLLKVELLPFTSGALQPSQIQKMQPHFRYLGTIPKSSPTAKLNMFDAEHTHSGMMAFKISSKNVNALKILISNLKLDHGKVDNLKSVVSMRIILKVGFSNFQDLLFNLDVTSPKVKFPLGNKKLESPCEKCESRRAAFMKGKKEPPKENGLKARAAKFITNGIELFDISDTQFNIALNGIPSNLHVKGNSNFNASFHVMAGMQSLPLLDINIGSRASMELSATPGVKSMDHDTLILGVSMNKVIHEKGILLATDKILNATVNSELRQQLPIFVKGATDKQSIGENNCFLKEIITSVSYKFAVDHPLNAKVIKNQTLSEVGSILSQRRNNQNKCLLEDENLEPSMGRFCSLGEFTQSSNGSSSQNITSARSNSIADIVACVPSSIDIPKDLNTATTSVIRITWQSKMFYQCLSLANEYSLNGLENVKAPIFWVEEISTGSYVQVALNVKNGNTNLLIKSKFRNTTSDDGYTISSLVRNVYNGDGGNYFVRFSKDPENSFLYKVFSRIIVDVVWNTVNDTLRATSFCNMLPQQGRFGYLSASGNVVTLSYVYTLELPSALNSALPKVDIGDVTVQVYDSEKRHAKLGDVTVSGKYVKSFMKTSVQLSYQFSLQKSAVNATASTAMSRFWGKIFSGSSTAVTLKLNHRNFKMQVPYKMPAGLLTQKCSNIDAVAEGNSFISRTKIIQATFGDTTCQGGIYDISMKITNLMPFTIRLRDKNANVACAYLYKNNDMHGTMYAIGCGHFTAANDKLHSILAYKSIDSVSIQINNTLKDSNYAAYQDYIGKSINLITSTWGINANDIVDGSNESHCATLRKLNNENKLNQFNVAIVAKAVVEFDYSKMQIDDLIFPSKTKLFNGVNNFETTTSFKLQYDKLPEKFNDEELKFVDLSRWDENDENYGNLDFAGATEDFNYYALATAFSIQGAGFMLMVVCFLFGCCSTCYSCLAVISNCRLCPCYKTLYMPQNHENTDYGFQMINPVHKNARTNADI